MIKNKTDIVSHRLYKALVYAETLLKFKGLWTEVEDHAIGDVLKEYQNTAWNQDLPPPTEDPRDVGC